MRAPKLLLRQIEPPTDRPATAACVLCVRALVASGIAAPTSSERSSASTAAMPLPPSSASASGSMNSHAVSTHPDRSPLSLVDALGEFFSVEDLGGDNCYR